MGIPLLLFAFIALVAFLFLLLSLFFFSKKKLDLRDKHVVITGAAQGIGRLMAEILLKEGCHVTLCDIAEELLTKTVEELKQKDPTRSVHGFVCNISTRDNVRRFHAQIKEKVAKEVDVVINNAGIVIGKPLLSLTENEIKKTMDVNLLSQFWMNQEFLPRMMERNQGTVVTIASTMGFFSACGLSDYCASKHALIGFHNAVRLEMKKSSASGIHMALICPNAINTGMFHGIKQGMQWLVPVLEPIDVAKATVEAIQYQQDLVILPKRLSPSAKIFKSELLPISVKDFFLNLGGATCGMDSFSGRPKKRE